MDGRQWWMDGATSGARRDSKRVGSRLLAGNEEGQHEGRNRTTDDAPRPSTLLPNDPKRPMYPPNPPCRRGRLKMNPRRISQVSIEKIHSPSHMVVSRPYWTSRICCICCTGTRDGAGAITRPRNAKTRPLESIKADRAHWDSCKDLAEPRLAISGNHSSAACRCHLE